MANYLQMSQKQQVLALLDLGCAHRRIQRETGVDRGTARAYDLARRPNPAKTFPARRRRTGFSLAIFMANAGGSWDNAKKGIESGELGGKYLKNAAGDYVDASGTKVMRKEDSKNPRQGATVIGDTVGDPFKDTSGPSLNILIKLISMVSVATIGITLAINNGEGLVKMVMEMLLR